MDTQTFSLADAPGLLVTAVVSYFVLFALTKLVGNK